MKSAKNVFVCVRIESKVSLLLNDHHRLSHIVYGRATTARCDTLYFIFSFLPYTYADELLYASLCLWQFSLALNKQK